MRMLCCLMDRGQHWARDFALATAGRRIAVRQVILFLMVAAQVMLHLFLEQAQIQLTESIGAQATGIKGRIISHQWHAK